MEDVEPDKLKSIKCTTFPPEIVGANIPSDSTETMCPGVEVITYPHISNHNYPRR